MQVARTVGSKAYLVDVPEGIGLYTLFGRSCTDNGDQHRKRLCLAARRQPRVGPKGALFDAELGLVNGAIIMSILRSAQGGVTTMEFLELYVDEVLSSVQLRRRSTAAQQAR